MKIAIIGAGAAGLMAAGKASSLGADVTLFEKNQKVGRKLMITGKGRCNITNCCDINEFLNNVPTNPRFLYSALNGFSPYDCISFFEDLGVKTKLERGNRIFPQSDKASDVVDALRKYSNCRTVFQKVEKLIIEDSKIKGVITEKGEYHFDRVIIATGGKSYPLTGSDGDGYRFARYAGHTVIPPKPSLVPLEVYEKYAARMQGLSLKNVSLKITDSETKKEVYSDFGEMMFTHFGITGPMVLSASSHIRDISETADPGKKYIVHIDFKPALDEKELDRRIISDFEKYSNKNFSNSLSDLLPCKAIPVITERSGIDEYKKVNLITKEERARLLSLLKDFTLTIKRTRPIAEAIITSGGVSVKEINPKTMESKLVSGLYFAGEIIDTDAYTGGFNLQIAFSTAVLAATAAAGKNQYQARKDSSRMFNIAIDGPSGAGKSSLAKEVAKRLGFIYVDTGALYRAIGLYTFRKGTSSEDTEKVISYLKDINIELKYEDGAQKVFMNGEDVSADIRINEISMYASNVSKIPEVREFLLDTQRDMAKRHNVIMDGRDIGTVILPDADVKIFLFADNRKRAERRHLELLEKGTDVSVEDLLHEMEERDRNDATRKIAPAVPAKDAVMLDNSEIDLEQTVQKALEIISEKIK